MGSLHETEDVGIFPKSSVVTRFVAAFKAALGPPKLATVLHRLAVLSKAHAVREVANPVKEVTVQEMLRRVRRAQAARGDFSNPKEALTRNPLEAMLATCTDGLIGISDRALLLFAWASGGRRRSEVTGAVMEQLTRVDAAPYLYRVGHSKTDQLGAGRQNVPLAEAMALTGHRSVATALRYFQTGAVEKSRAGNLLNAVAGEKK